jgi:flagellar FliJ protein
MAKFTYRLQNILDIKKKLESQSKVEYMIANTKLKDEQDKLSKIILTRVSYENQARSLETGKLDVISIKECHRAIDVMKEKQKAQTVNVQVAERNLEIARENLNKVMVERKTHEKLKEKAFEEFKQDLAHAESKEVDEMVSYSYHEG